MHRPVAAAVILNSIQDPLLTMTTAAIYLISALWIPGLHPEGVLGWAPNKQNPSALRDNIQMTVDHLNVPQDEGFLRLEGRLVVAPE